MSFVVIKFGGTSVSSLSCWQNIAVIAKCHLEQDLKPVIVCSAPSQVSNLLETLLEQAPQSEHQKTLAAIESIYRSLATELGLVDSEQLDEALQSLQQMILGISLLGEASPKTKARVMAYGELMLTQLAVAYLQQSGLSARWEKATDLLAAKALPHASERQRYLAVDCYYEFDQALVDRLSALSVDVVVTQGFIASNEQGETVLLGRGGSDVSAAYLAAKLAAKCCEIWTDVPGVYTTNPHLIPAARLLKSLSYIETQEIASMGAKVLHPRCIAPVQERQIPLLIKYTKEPEREGTLITQSASEQAQIKSILVKTEVILISIEAMGMWRQVGFLAKIFACFKEHGISIDLVSTAESNVTASLDKKANLIDARSLEALLADLNQFSVAKTIGPCAVIGLVGQQIRTILHKLGDTFSVFESKQIHMLTQSSNDLSLAFVVDEEEALPIAQKLHHLLIEQNNDSMYLGSSWQEEFGQLPAALPAWWRQAQCELLGLAEQTPIYVYDQKSLVAQAKKLLACRSIDRVFYAIKANPHQDILQTFYELGLGFECVSLGEVQHVIACFPGIDRQRILFTPNFAARIEYKTALQRDVRLTIDNLYPLSHWGELFTGKNVILRIDPGHGYGHHKFVTTGGKNSKFGIPINALDQVAELAQRYNFNVVGLHAHSGSGIRQADNWRESAVLLTGLLEQFPKVRSIDLGGGLSIAEKPGQSEVDIKQIDQALKAIKDSCPGLEIWIEPGRYLVAEAGVLLAQVTQLKEKAGTYYVGINAGMNSLIRPALYGAYHEIVNLSRLDQPREVVANVVGPICESGDTLGYSRLLPKTSVGDILLIANAGAYGASMSSQYNLRQPAAEVMVETQSC